MIRFLARHRHLITGIVVVGLIILFVYMAIKTKDLKIGTYNNKTYSGIAFGTAIKKTIFAEGDEECDKVDYDIDKILKSVDEKLSYREPGSEIDVLNNSYAAGGIYSLSPDILMYVQKELDIYKETKGAFSPCILPLSKLWGIEDGEARVPEDDEIEAVLEHTNADNIVVTDEGLTFNDISMAIDFGAVGKGIAADEVLSELSKSSVKGAVVSVGGTIATYGVKGADDKWHIGIQDPRAEDGKVFAVLDVQGGTVISTSGDYEKYFEADGKRYHHIFDPGTGYPVDNGVISVTIATNNGFLSDALSTACFVMGVDKGLAYAESKGVDAIFVTSDKKVYVTKNLRKKFHIKNTEYKLVK